MYCGMSSSMFSRALLYDSLPPSSPPSSAYCIQRSVSRISAAARNRSIAMSPWLRPLLAPAAAPAKSEPGTTAVAPTSPALIRNDRRPTTRFQTTSSGSGAGADDTVGLPFACMLFPLTARRQVPAGVTTYGERAAPVFGDRQRAERVEHAA